MTIVRVLRVLAASAVVAGSGSAQAAPAQSAESEVVDVLNRLFDGMRRVDSAMVRPLFHAKARLITTSMREGAPVVRVQDSVEGFIASIGRPRTEVWDERLSNVKVTIDGPLASVWADYHFYRGMTLSHCGVDHVLLVKEGASWKIIELSDTRRETGC